MEGGALMEKKFLKRVFSRLMACCILVVMMVTGLKLAVSAPAFDGSFIIEQPDGSSFLAVSRGDEWLNWTETVSGYAIAKSLDGFWYYVIEYDENNLPVFSTTPANKSPLTSFRAHVNPFSQADGVKKNLHK